MSKARTLLEGEWEETHTIVEDIPSPDMKNEFEIQMEIESSEEYQNWSE